MQMYKREDFFTNRKCFNCARQPIYLGSLNMYNNKKSQSHIHNVSHCAIEGTSFACDGGGSGGGQFGALSPGFFGGGFLGMAG